MMYRPTPGHRSGSSFFIGIDCSSSIQIKKMITRNPDK
jgi:hypothetical protein